MPPLAPGSLGVSIAHIQSGQWAERSGLKEGDIITHVGGKAVTEMRSPEEFMQSLSGRPLKLIVQIAISKAEISGVLDSFDWSSRFQRVDKSRKEAGNDPEATNQMFDRVLGDSSPFEAKSSLFDVSRWIGSGPEKEPPAVVVQKPEPNPPVIVLSKPTPVEEKRPIRPSPKISTKTVLKWVPSYPLCVWIKIDRGFALPQRAGTLGLDYWFQPFSAEPFVELSLVASPSKEVTLDEILDSKPVEPTAVLQSPVCDANSLWNYSGSLLLISENIGEGDLMLVGKLLDYRRLESPKPMGAFAMRVETLEVSDDIGKVKPSLISMTLIDSYTFDVSKTKIRMSMCLKGRQVTHSESVKRGTKEASDASPPSVESSLRSSPSASGLQTPAELQAPPLKPVVVVAPSPVLTPFERAHKQALLDIKRGDNSPIRSQEYTLR